MHTGIRSSSGQEKPERLIISTMSQASDPKSSAAAIQQRAFQEAELNRLALMRYRRRNWLLGLGLLAGVLGIYGYSICAVKQESLDLDELDKPAGQETSSSK